MAMVMPCMAVEQVAWMFMALEKTALNRRHVSCCAAGQKFLSATKHLPKNFGLKSFGQKFLDPKFFAKMATKRGLIVQSYDEKAASFLCTNISATQKKQPPKTPLKNNLF
jgi:hypothetical protein